MWAGAVPGRQEVREGGGTPQQRGTDPPKDVRTSQAGADIKRSRGWALLSDFSWILKAAAHLTDKMISLVLPLKLHARMQRSTFSGGGAKRTFWEQKSHLTDATQLSPRCGCLPTMQCGLKCFALMLYRVASKRSTNRSSGA